MSAMAGDAAAREDRMVLGFATALVAVGAGSAFAGPAGVWGVIAVGGGVMAVGYAVYQVWQRRA